MHKEPFPTPEKHRGKIVEDSQATTDKVKQTVPDNGNVSVIHNPNPKVEDSQATTDKVKQTVPDNGNVSVIHNPKPNRVRETSLQGTNNRQANHLHDSEVSQPVYDQGTSFHDVVEISNHTAPSETELNEAITQIDVVESISLIRRRIELGNQNAIAHNDKDGLAILGDTGTGKSTSTNYWMGCRMELRTPEELEEMGIEGELENAIVVHPDSERPEAASIGHGKNSHTLIPQIIQDANQDTRVYIDCPGFSDNRGPEINIANAINIRRGLQQVKSVKAVFLASYPELIASRGEYIRNLEHMCQQLFGGVDNLKNHQNSVLLGINRAPAQTSIHIVRTWLTRTNRPTAQILAQRAFLYDPLERGGEDFWSRAQFLAKIEQMPAIPQRVAENLFQTVLTDGDKVMLQHIVRHQVDAMSCALEQSDYPAADRCWNLLNQLRIIEHGEIGELMAKQVRPHMCAYAQERTAVFNRYAAQHDFTGAERLLALLRSLQTHFPGEDLVDLEGLEARLQTARAQYTAQREAEEAEQIAAEERQRAEEAGQRAVEERQIAEKARQRAEEERDRARREREAMEAQIRRREAELEGVRRRKKNQTRARNN